MQMTFGSPPAKVGSYCLIARGQLSGMRCSYPGFPVSQPAQPSVDGFSVITCAPPTTTTCPGLLDASGARKNCDNDSSVCGIAGLQDAACEEGVQRCSYNCAANNDCPSPLTCVAGNICGVAAQ